MKPATQCISEARVTALLDHLPQIVAVLAGSNDVGLMHRLAVGPTVPFTCHSAPWPYASFLVVALARSWAFLIIPDIRLLQAVATEGGNGGDRFS